MLRRREYYHRDIIPAWASADLPRNFNGFEVVVEGLYHTDVILHFGQGQVVTQVLDKMPMQEKHLVADVLRRHAGSAMPAEYFVQIPDRDLFIQIAVDCLD